MSRIGFKPITVPDGVEVKLDGQTLTVKGKKGELSREIPALLTVNIDESELTVERPNDSKEAKTIHGTTRANIQNMVEGVTEGFVKKLELIGVGYRAQMQGNKLNLNVGLSHPVEFVPGDDLTIETPDNTHITVSGIDKEAVGQLAAQIRQVRPPEPYKGKGIRYEDEYVIRKEGKKG